MRAETLSATAFAPFGQVVEAAGDSSEANQGRAQRFDTPLDMARTNSRTDRLHTAIYHIRKSDLPFTLTVIERHPLSLQLFFPNSGARFLVCACPALGNGDPDLRGLRAYIGHHTQGIVWRTGVWHAPFVALDADGDFLTQQWQHGGPMDCEERPLALPVMIEG